MKTGNTLRAARNSLLCFFMALAAGFLVACGGGGGGDVGGGGGGNITFPVYLSDAAVEGAEYSSGPASNGLTEKGGVFMADEGVFEFSIGATALGSVQISRAWDGSQVTPADFMGVDEEKVIDIARILQGLDEDGNPQNGILISQNARENAPDLFPRVDSDDAEFPVVIGGETFMIPPKDEATDHLVATRKCLFSGGYSGRYLATSVSYTGTPDEGGINYVVEPFANRIRGVEFSDIYPDDNDSALLSVAINVGAIGSVVTLSLGNELSFVTPRLVTGIWADSDGPETESGTYRLALVAGNPGATRRVVGVETDNSTVAVGLYAIDYFADDGSFRGQYYDVENGGGSPLTLTIAGGGSWPTDTTPTELVLSGTLGGEATAITVEVVRKDENYGSFEREVGTQVLSGTWCDIGGATGVAVLRPQTPPAPSASARSESEIEITWSAVSGATRYYLYRSTSSDGITLIGDNISTLRYRDSGLSENTEYFYRLEACNSVGCSEELSPEVSVTTQSAAPVDPSGGGGGGGGGLSFNNTGTCRSFLNRPLSVGESCTWATLEFAPQASGALLVDDRVPFNSSGVSINGGTINNSPPFIFFATRSGTTWTITRLE